MNAIAYCPQRGYVDPYNGRADIESRIVRAVGDAKSRFTEDALRMLRAVRFACTLGFSVCENAVKAMRELAKNLENVSQERVRDELGKMLTGEHIHNMKMLETCGLLAQIFRNGYSGDFQLALQRAANAPRNEAMRLALFLSHETSETAAETLRSLRYDNRTISAVAGYISNIHGETSAERADVKRLLRSLGADMYDTLLVLREICGDKPAIIALAREQARDIVASGEPYTMAHLAVDGRDLASIGYKPTPEMGAELEHLLEIVTNEPTKNKRDILLKMAASRL
jgi:tRNA nucleotidyltransferase (CCA-adding enzyme)